MATPTARTRGADEAALTYALKTLIEVPVDATDAHVYDHNHLVQALKHEKIASFESDLCGASTDDFPKYQYPSTPDDETSTMRNISVKDQRSLHQLVAFYHHTSRRLAAPLDITSVDLTSFLLYKSSMYNPKQDVIKWNLPLPAPGGAAGPATTTATSTPAEIEVKNWLKQMKPNKSAYSEFKDDAYHVTWVRKFTTTLTGQGLSHLIDPSYTPTNPDLDKMQQAWLHDVWQDVMKTSFGKSLVTKYNGSPDSRAFWTEFQTFYKNSTHAETRANKITAYLTSNRLKDGSWKGTYKSYILNWREQTRELAEITTVNLKFNGEQLCTFLNLAMTGVPELNMVKRNIDMTTKAAATATGTPIPDLDFDHYVEELVNVSTTIDLGRTQAAGNRPRRFVGVHDIVFDGEETLPQDTYEIQAHDIDTDIDQLEAHMAGQSAQNTRVQPPTSRPRLDRKTWMSLTIPDRKAWDTVSDDGKRKIIAYVPMLQPARVPYRAPPIPQQVNFHTGLPVSQLETNVHKTQGPESTTDAPPKDEAAAAPAPNIEAHAHDLSRTKTEHPLLQLATKKNTPGDIRAMLSQTVDSISATKSGTVYEVNTTSTFDRTPTHATFTPSKPVPHAKWTTSVEESKGEYDPKNTRPTPKQVRFSPYKQVATMEEFHRQDLDRILAHSTQTWQSGDTEDHHSSDEDDDSDKRGGTTSPDSDQDIPGLEEPDASSSSSDSASLADDDELEDNASEKTPEDEYFNYDDYDPSPSIFGPIPKHASYVAPKPVPHASFTAIKSAEPKALAVPEQVQSADFRAIKDEDREAITGPKSLPPELGARMLPPFQKVKKPFPRFLDRIKRKPSGDGFFIEPLEGPASQPPDPTPPPPEVETPTSPFSFIGKCLSPRDYRMSSSSEDSDQPPTESDLIREPTTVRESYGTFGEDQIEQQKLVAKDQFVRQNVWRRINDNESRHKSVHAEASDDHQAHTPERASSLDNWVPHMLSKIAEDLDDANEGSHRDFRKVESF